MEIGDIFGIWPSTAEMAADIRAKPDTVRKWKKFRRIPETQWPLVIEAATNRGHPIGASDLLGANAPMKMRGRPSHKPKRRARKSPTAQACA